MSEIRLLRIAAQEAYEELQNAYNELPLSVNELPEFEKADVHLRKLNEWLFAMKEQH